MNFSRDGMRYSRDDMRDNGKFEQMMREMGAHEKPKHLMPYDWTEADTRTVAEGYADGEYADDSGIQSATAAYRDEITHTLCKAVDAANRAEKVRARLGFRLRCWRNFALVVWAVLVYELWRSSRG